MFIIRQMLLLMLMPLATGSVVAFAGSGQPTIPSDGVMRLKVIDNVTSRPIPGFMVLLDFDEVHLENELLNDSRLKYDPRAKNSVMKRVGKPDAEGLFKVPLGPLIEVYRKKQKADAERAERTGEDLTSEQDPDSPWIHVGIIAPGYARQGFGISTNEILSGKPRKYELMNFLKIRVTATEEASDEIVLPLEPEAVVIGRIRLPGGNASATTPMPTGDRKRNSRRSTNWIKLYNQQLGFRMQLVGEGECVATNGSDDLDSQGSFRIEGLKAAPDWELIAVVAANPTLERKNIRLKPGVNDLGEIGFDINGTLEIQAKEPNGAPLAQALVFLPYGSGLDQREEERQETGGDGRLVLDIRKLGREQQLIKIAPPGGYELTYDATPPKMSAWYDKITTLSNSQANQQKITINKGHTLTVQIPVTPELIQAAHYYADGDHYPYDVEQEIKIRGEGKVQLMRHFGITGILMETVKPDADGFVYHRDWTVKGKVVRLDTGSAKSMLTFKIPDVSPGHLMLRLDGSAYGLAPDGEIYPSAPLAIDYMELSMPDTDHAITMPTSGREMEIKLSSPPANPQTIEGLMVFLERVGPQSTAFGEPIRQGLSFMPYRRADLRQLAMPFIERAGKLTCFENDKITYQPAHLLCVPPGHYRLRAIKQAIFGTLSPTPYWEKSYYQTEIDVPAGDKGKITLTIPAP